MKNGIGVLRDENGKARTTISLPPDIMEKGVERKRQRRAASFSNYVEILIAEDIAAAASAGSAEKPEAAHVG